jgi:hypothetical protein
MASVAGGRISAGVGANLIGQHSQDRNQEATVYVGNLDPQVRHRTSARPVPLMLVSLDFFCSVKAVQGLGCALARIYFCL